MWNTVPENNQPAEVVTDLAQKMKKACPRLFVLVGSRNSSTNPTPSLQVGALFLLLETMQDLRNKRVHEH